jgi:2-dehydropantoate 2-reductase
MSFGTNVAPFRVAIVGAGAIGCYYGAKLVHGGCDVHFLMRAGVTEVRESGLSIRGRNETLQIRKINCYATSEEIGPSDLVIVSVKTTANTVLQRLIPPLLHPETMLLTLQNGFGNEQFLASHFGAERVMGALCFVCVNRISPGVIDEYYPGRVMLGEYDRPSQLRTHKVAETFQRCGVICSVVENLALERWRKLVWNIPFNGLSIASGGIDTAAILSDDRLRADCIALMKEVILAAGKCGFVIVDGVVAEEIKRTESMGAYKPSTLIDFEAKRPLEIESIWGEPLRRAEAAGAKVPRLKELYARLSGINSRL